MPIVERFFGHTMWLTEYMFFLLGKIVAAHPFGDQFHDNIVRPVLIGLRRMVEWLDMRLKTLTPCETILYMIVMYLQLWLIIYVFQTLRGVSWTKTKEKVFRFAKYIPMVQSEIAKEEKKALKGFTEKYSKSRKGHTIYRLPELGI